MVVGLHVGPPFVEEADTVTRLGENGRKPVAVQVEPVMVEASAGPDLIVFAVERVWYRGLSPVHVGPVRMPVAPVWVYDGVHGDDHTL